MVAPLHERDNFCPAGSQWYVCQTPKFQGCCSVDACTADGCPDSPTSEGSSPSTPSSIAKSTKSPSTSTSSTTTNPVTVVPSTTTFISTFVTSETTTADGSVITITSIQATEPVVSTSLETVSASMMSMPSATGSASAMSVSSASRLPVAAIVGGAVGGSTILLLLALVVLLCMRTRKRRHDRRKAATMQRRSGPAEMDRNAENIFAPFGGFFRGAHQDIDGQDQTPPAPDESTTASPSSEEMKLPPAMQVQENVATVNHGNATNTYQDDSAVEMPDTSHLVLKRLSELEGSSPRDRTSVSSVSVLAPRSTTMSGPVSPIL